LKDKKKNCDANCVCGLKIKTKHHCFSDSYLCPRYSKN